jgi:hypothetical protein
MRIQILPNTYFQTHKIATMSRSSEGTVSEKERYVVIIGGEAAAIHNGARQADQVDT